MKIGSMSQLNMEELLIIKKELTDGLKRILMVFGFALAIIIFYAIKNESYVIFSFWGLIAIML